MKIFIAGATSVVGRRAVPLLLAAGHQVTAAGRDPTRLRSLAAQGAVARAVDLFDPEAVRGVVEGAEAIVNLATAVPAPGPGMLLRRSWRGMDRIRREVSRNLVEAALAGATVRRMVQESFAPIYADAGDTWVDETASTLPAAYNRTALDAEAQVTRFTDAGRVGAVLRFGLFYGSGDAATATLLNAVKRGWFPIFGRPEAYISWIAHNDAASAVVAALGVPAGIYNVVEDEPMRRRELADGLARVVGVGPPRFLPAWATRLGGAVGPTMARSLRISNRKLRDASEWAPTYPTALEGMGAILRHT